MLVGLFPFVLLLLVYRFLSQSCEVESVSQLRDVAIVCVCVRELLTLFQREGEVVIKCLLLDANVIRYAITLSNFNFGDTFQDYNTFFCCPLDATTNLATKMNCDARSK